MNEQEETIVKFSKLRDHALNSLIRMSKDDEGKERAYQAAMTLYVIAEGKLEDEGVEGAGTELEVPPPRLETGNVFDELDDILGGN